MAQAYTKDELEQIATALQRITIKGLPVFDVQLLNRTLESIGLNDAQGIVYMNIATHKDAGNFRFEVKEG